MNQEELLKFRNDCSRYVSFASLKRNVINLNVHNSLQHELIKFRICYELRKQEKEFITEAHLKGDSHGNKGIVDILVLDTAQIIEIMVSEKLNNLEWKSRKYPDFFEIIAVKNWQEYFNENYKVIKERKC